MPCRTVNNKNKRTGNALKGGDERPLVNSRNGWCTPLLPTRVFLKAGTNMEMLRYAAAAAELAGWGSGSPKLTDLELLDEMLRQSRRMIRRVRCRIQRLTIAIMNGESQSKSLAEVLKGVLVDSTEQCVQYFRDRLLVVERADREITKALDYQPNLGPAPIILRRSSSECGVCSRKAKAANVLNDMPVCGDCMSLMHV